MNRKLTILLMLMPWAALCVVRSFHAGILDPDEVDCLNLSRMGLVQMWHWIGYDSYPMLCPILLKMWAWVFGYSDVSVRLFGLGIQFGLITSVWWFCVKLETLPRFTALVLLLPAFIDYTGNLRAWGLGLLTLTLLMLACYSRTRWSIRLIAALVACHSTYYNCILMFCIFAPRLSGFRGALRREIITCVVCAVSMTIYLPAVLGEASHYRNLHVGYDFGAFWAHLGEVLSTGGILMVTLFMVVLTRFTDAWPKLDHLRIENCRYDLLLSFCVYFLFLQHLHYATQPWYYLPLLLYTALTLDMTYKEMKWREWLFIGGAAASLIIPAWNAAHTPSTAMGPALKKLKDEYCPGDLVVTTPWQSAIQVEWYDPKVEFVTVPPGITNNLCHRFDLEANYIDTHPEPEISATTQAIDMAIRSGRQVFILGNIDWHHLHDPAPKIAQLRAMWPNCANSQYYSVIMNEQLANFLQMGHPPREVVADDRQDGLLVIHPVGP